MLCAELRDRVSGGRIREYASDCKEERLVNEETRRWSRQDSVDGGVQLSFRPAEQKLVIGELLGGKASHSVPFVSKC
jgi:hypothetical protein